MGLDALQQGAYVGCMFFLFAASVAATQLRANEAMAACLVPMIVAQSPLLLRLIHAPARSRRYWTNWSQHGGIWQVWGVDAAGSHIAAGRRDVADAIYRELWRLNVSAFEGLHALVRHRLSRLDTRWRAAIPTRMRLAILLYWLAHGHTQTTIARTFGCSQTSVSFIIREGVQVLLDVLWPIEFGGYPAGAALARVSHGFLAQAGMPGCIGAIDGTFFHIHKPPTLPIAYWCYKRHYAIAILACCDASLRFLWVDVGAPGAVGDAAIWMRSNLRAELAAGTIQLPDGETPVLTVRQRGALRPWQAEPYVVADAAFALAPWCLKCYDPASTPRQQQFNACVIRTRRFIENAFAHLKMRWRIVWCNSITDPDYARDVARACCALHNYCMAHSPQLHNAQWADMEAAVRARQGAPDATSAGGTLPADERLPTGAVSGMQARDALAEWMFKT
jgi:hypothetical protein